MLPNRWSNPERLNLPHFLRLAQTSSTGAKGGQQDKKLSKRQERKQRIQKSEIENANKVRTRSILDAMNYGGGLNF